MDINVEMNSTVNEAQKDSRGFPLPRRYWHLLFDQRIAKKEIQLAAEMTRNPEKAMIKQHKRNKIMPEYVASAWDTLHHTEPLKAIPKKGESKLQSCSIATRAREAAGVPSARSQHLDHLDTPASTLEHMGYSRM